MKKKQTPKIWEHAQYLNAHFKRSKTRINKSLLETKIVLSRTKENNRTWFKKRKIIEIVAGKRK